MAEHADCLFCNIVKGTTPATMVRKTDRFLAFRDVRPQAPTHILVIPRAHVASLDETNDPDLLGQWMLFIRNLARAEGLAEDGYRVVVNSGPNGGQSVFHLHAHVLGGRALQWPPG